MKSIFDAATRAELTERIEQIKETDTARWGKMNVYQMLLHNGYWNAWMLGKGDFSYRQEFPGKIFGKMALRKMIRDDKPLDKNIPTSKPFKPTSPICDLETEKARWISLTEAYATYHNPAFIHDFFGSMSREEIGILVYKHSDHHLRQFGK